MLAEEGQVCEGEEEKNEGASREGEGRHGKLRRTTVCSRTGAREIFYQRMGSWTAAAASASTSADDLAHRIGLGLTMDRRPGGGRGVGMKDDESIEGPNTRQSMPVVARRNPTWKLQNGRIEPPTEEGLSNQR